MEGTGQQGRISSEKWKNYLDLEIDELFLVDSIRAELSPVSL
jgi:hypothetical protein